MDTYIIRTGIMEKAMKRDHARPSDSRRFNKWRFVDVRIGTKRVFFRPSDDAVAGISLTRRDLLRLAREIEDWEGAVVIERMSRVYSKKRVKRTRRKAS